jgi:hypothetical protein
VTFRVDDPPFLPLIRQKTVALVGTDDPIITGRQRQDHQPPAAAAGLHTRDDGCIGPVTRTSEISPTEALVVLSRTGQQGGHSRTGWDVARHLTPPRGVGARSRWRAFFKPRRCASPGVVRVAATYSRSRVQTAIGHSYA